MSHGFRYKSEMDALLHQSINRIGEITMTPNNIVDIVNGLVMSEESKGNVGPWKVTLPVLTDIHLTNDKGETLLDRIHAINPQIKEVVVDTGRGVSIEKI